MAAYYTFLVNLKIKRSNWQNFRNILILKPKTIGPNWFRHYDRIEKKNCSRMRKHHFWISPIFRDTPRSFEFGLPCSVYFSLCCRYSLHPAYPSACGTFRSKRAFAIPVKYLKFIITKTAFISSLIHGIAVSFSYI